MHMRSLHLIARPRARHQQPAPLRLRRRQQHMREERRRSAALQQQPALQVHLHCFEKDVMIMSHARAGAPWCMSPSASHCMWRESCALSAQVLLSVWCIKDSSWSSS